MGIVRPFAFIKNPVAGIALDPDAYAFLNAAGLFGDPTIVSAIDTLVIDLKAYGIWSLMQVIYPMVGGTSATTSWNLIDPRNLQVAYKMVYQGTGWVFDANGAKQSNNSLTYGITYYRPSTNTAAEGASMSIYVNGGTNDFGYDLASSLSTSETYIIAGFGNNTLYTRYWNATPLTYTGATMPNGFHHSAGNASGIQLYRNGSQVVTSAQARGTGNTTSLYLGNRNGGAPQPTDRRYAFVSMGKYLDSTQQGNFYTAVQAFQTTLGRQV
jgi:hypothetical protein